MPFQTSVPAGSVSGYIGELSHCGPTRSVPAVIDPDATPADVLVGRYFTYSDTAAELVEPGGTGPMGGILILPKTHARPSLADTLVLPVGEAAEFLQMGEVFVELATTGGVIGGYVVYNTTTGILDWVADPGTPGAGNALVPNARIVRHNISAAAPELACIRLTN